MMAMDSFFNIFLHDNSLSAIQAYSWSVKALQSLVPNFPKPPLIDVLRQSAKACVLKREFKKARLLIKQVRHYNIASNSGFKLSFGGVNSWH